MTPEENVVLDSVLKLENSDWTYFIETVPTRDLEKLFKILIKAIRENGQAIKGELN